MAAAKVALWETTSVAVKAVSMARKLVESMAAWKADQMVGTTVGAWAAKSVAWKAVKLAGKWVGQMAACWAVQ